MVRRNNPAQDIYILSLDTFMIMTVMGITLGIIFFILNPTLKKGRVIKRDKTEVYVNLKQLERAKKILIEKHEKPDILKGYPKMMLTKYLENGEKLLFHYNQDKNKIVKDSKGRERRDYYIAFVLRNKNQKVIEDNKLREEAIKRVQLDFLLSE